MVLVKECSKCGGTKLMELFNKSSRSKMGRTSHCKACRKEARENNKEAIAAQRKAYYEANKEVLLTEAKQDRQENPEKYKAKEAAKYLRHQDDIKARVLDYQKRKPEVYRKAGKKYREDNPHLGRAKTAKRRAAKLRATPVWGNSEFEQFYIAELYHLAQLRGEAGIPCHVDHIVPLISKLVCGLHCAANLRILPAKENESKGNRFWPDMW